MTAIPAATEEDFKRLEEIEPLYQTLQELIDDPVVTQDAIITPADRIYDHKETQQLLRLLSHYQRENERLARQRDEVLRVMTLEQVEALAGAAYDRTDPIALAFFLSEKQRRMEEPQCQLPRL